MDFTFTEEQQAAAEAARAVFSGTAPDSVPSPQGVPPAGGSGTALGAVADDFDRDLWRKLADADLLGLLVPVRHGGSGLDPVALCLVLREAGRVLARVPLLETSAAAHTLGSYADDELCARLLPAITRGELSVTVAAHGRTGHEPPERAVDARPAPGGGLLLDGVQTAVPWAATAGRVLVPCSTDDGRAALALIDPAGEGVTLSDQVSTNGERYAELRLASAPVPAGDVVTADGAVGHVQRLLATGTCATALGLGSRVLEMTAEYTSGREQFGFPVATFQAVAVQAADRFIDLRAMEATLWQAAWRPEPTEVAVAKIWASEGVRRVVQTAQHLHGGFGTDTEYVLHRFHAWAKQLELALGPAPAHEEALGALLAHTDA